MEVHTEEAALGVCVAAEHLHVVLELVLQVLQQAANESRCLFAERLHLGGAGFPVLVSAFPAEGDKRRNTAGRTNDTA